LEKLENNMEKVQQKCRQKGRAKRAPLLLRQFFVRFPYLSHFFQKMAQVVFHKAI